MSTKSLSRKNEFLPSVFNNFFSPWNEVFDDRFERTFSVPAVNVTENKEDYKIALAVPGLKKDDFKIHVEGNLMTLSAEKEESKNEKDEHYTRREYNYSSFSRTFTLPDGVNAEKIEATYDNGILKMTLPKKEETKKVTAKTIAVK